MLALGSRLRAPIPTRESTVSRELPPRFDPGSIESDLYRRWTEKGYFNVPPQRVLDDGADPFVIVIPPPNVTDILHMGHGLNNTIQDVLNGRQC